MMVRVLYFAAVRDVTTRGEESLDLPETVRTVEHFAGFLATRYPPLADRLRALRFARNEVFADAEDALAPGDVLAVIPPVAGG
jgi:molybdopterin converting factor subunit 1